MDPRRLRYFLAVVEEMHFGRAADRLHMAQPALSQQIKRLEHDVGVALFDRSRRRIELTEAGKILAVHGRRHLEDAGRIEAAARMAGRGEIGTLRVGMVGSAVVGFLPAMMRAFRHRYPAARLELVEMPSGLGHVEALSERRIDAGLIRFPPPADPEVAVEPMLDEPLLAVLPADHSLAGERSIELCSLRDEPFVLWPRWHSPRLYDETFSETGSLGFSPRIAQEANGIHANLALVAAGTGISLLPTSVRALHRDGVILRPLAEPAPTTTLAAAWHRDNRSPLLRSFLDLTRDILTAAPQPGAAKQ